MRGVQSLLEREQRESLRQQPEALRALLEELHAEDLAEALDGVASAEVIEILRVLPEAYGASVLACFGEEQRAVILENLKPEEAALLLSAMEPDERADAVQTLEMPLQQALLAELDRARPGAADEVRELTSYPEDTAGGIMTTAFAALDPETKVWQAIDRIRALSQVGSAETVYYLYVVAFGERLVGVVSLRDLILADPSQGLRDIMTENVIYVRDRDEQKDVAKLIAKYDFQALPVVDIQGRMVGVVTLDDVMDVVIEEATEDVHKMGAVSPMANSYLDTEFASYWRSRVTWLVILFLGGFMTASVMERFQTQLSHSFALMFFIPLIISTGGNAGSQSAALVIRALATDEIRPRDWMRVVVREAAVGVALGVVVGGLGFLRAFFGPLGAGALAITVGISILMVVTVGALLGSVFPLVIARLGFDPAVSSTPFIASLSDVVGLLIYLGVAEWVMHA